VCGVAANPPHHTPHSSAAVFPKWFNINIKLKGVRHDVNRKHIFNWQMFLGVVLVVTGGLFLVDQLLGIQIMAYFWPLLVVLFGLTFFVSMLVGGRKGAGLAIPGAVITTLGTLLFIQNAFNLWATWTYAWALLTTAAGLGMLIMNGYLKREGLRRAAGVVIGIGLISFVVFGVLFEVILNISGANIYSGIFLGAGLILLGLFVVFSRPLFAHRKSAQVSRNHRWRKCLRCLIKTSPQTSPMSLHRLKSNPKILLRALNSPA
jgi:hypothetical protein